MLLSSSAHARAKIFRLMRKDELCGVIVYTDPPNVTRFRKNAYKKLMEAAVDLEWALRIGVGLSNLARALRLKGLG